MLENMNMNGDERIFLSLGANLGDRQGNLLQALQYLGARATVRRLSSFYETDPVGCEGAPPFLNAVCEVATDLKPRELLEFLLRIEKRMGRLRPFRNAPRPIDIDLLFYGKRCIDEPDLVVPHPRIAERGFVLIPLAEIAPEFPHPLLGRSAAELAEAVGTSGVKKVERSLRLRLSGDPQQCAPEVSVGLSRVGVTNLERVIRLGGSERSDPALFHAWLDLFADLGPEQAGVHMSRFSDALEELVEELTTSAFSDVESLAERLALAVARTQKARFSQVSIRARYPLTRITPISGKRVEDMATFLSIAASDGERTRHLVGVEVDGLTVCPCAQEMVRSYERRLLLDEGFSEEQAEKILDLLPIASHNQRGRGTLLMGGGEGIRAEHLVSIVEVSMSSEVYELLKRPDEFFLVNKAHRNPRFVEDVVREMLQNLLLVYADFPGNTFVLARQENLESIHRHNAFAEYQGTLAEIRGEIEEGRPRVKHTSLDAWLREGWS